MNKALHLPKWLKDSRNLPMKKQNFITKEKALRDLMQNIYAIDRDCTDDDFMNRTILQAEKVIELFSAPNKEEMKVRNQLLDYLYDLHEYTSPDDKRPRFEIIKRSVKNIKANKGEFDYNPLNVAAKRIHYFMHQIPIAERYKLMLEIKRKTKDPQTYNYDYILKELANEYKTFQDEQKYLQHLEKLDRYDEIRDLLAKAPDNQTQIALYNELLPLIDEQAWGRGHKFSEKKTIYNHLKNLYQTEGMKQEACQAALKSEKFRKALKRSEIAALKKGYMFSNRKSDGYEL